MADAAGVTRGAVYHDFESKADLFEAMVARAEMPMDAAFYPTNGTGADPLGALRERALSALLHLSSSPRVRRVFEVVFLRCEYTDELASVEKHHLEEREHCLGLCNALLDEAVSQGQLPRNTDTRAASLLLYAFIGGLMRDWVQAPKSFDLETAAPQLVDLFSGRAARAPPSKVRARRARAARREVDVNVNGR